MIERESERGGGLRFGVRLPVTGEVATSENLVTVASLAEQLGYHSMWCSDHLLPAREIKSRYPGTVDGRWPFPRETRWLEPLTTLTWLSTVAPSVDLGTAVLILPLRNPVVLAKQTSTLDFLSSGRLVLGIGVGWMQEEFAAVGIGYSDRARRTTEAIDLLRHLWTGDEVEFIGEFWRVSAAEMHPEPLRRSIPIVWGGMAGPTVRRVAQTGDGWLPTFHTVDGLATGIARLRVECERANRAPGDIRIIYKPGPTFEFNSEAQATLLDLGVTDYIFDPHPDRLDRSTCEQDMLRLAEVGGLTLRGT